MIIDRRDAMEPVELWQELELRYPEKIVDFERQWPEIVQLLVEDEDLSDVDEEDLEEFIEDICSLLKV